MKTKKSKLIAFAVACILAICAIAVAACDFKFRSKELVDLKIDTANVQTVFHPGDEFNSDNLVVTAHYDDGSKVVLKSGYHVRGVAIDHVTTDETRAEGRDSVRVVYGEKETTYDVTISQVASLRLDTGAVQKSFRQDAPFTYDKLKVYARYTDGTERLLESGEYSATADTGRTGSATATVTATFPVFGERGAVVSQAFTANYQISVQAHNLKSIYVKEGPATKDYFVGDAFDPAGLEVYGVFEGEADRLVEDEFTFTADGLEDGVFTKAGNIEVTVHDGELTATFSVNVTAVALENIELGGTYAKEFFAGDALDYKGLTVTAVYNNGDRKPVTSGFTVTANNLDGGKLTVQSDTVTVSYEEGGVRKDATYNITVKAVVLDKIEISTPASKLEFFTSETFTAEGLAITATYNNKTTKVVAYTEAENNGLTVVKPTMSAGSQQVTVKFTDGGVTKEATYNITVKAVVLDRIELGGTYATEFFAGDTLDYDGLTVTAVYNDGNSKPVESGFTVTANNLDGDKLTVKSDTVTVSYEDGGVTKDATYKITVQGVVVESLTLGGEYNTDFYVGDEFNHDGLTVTAHFNHGDDQVVTEKAEVSEPDLTSAGKKQVTVTYGAGEATYTVTVYNKLTGLLVEDSVKEYKAGNTFDQSTLTVKALYNNAADGETVEGFTVKDAPDGALEAQEYTVTVEYTVDDAENFNRGTATKEYTFNVTQAEAKATGIEIVSTDHKTNYLVGDPFDASALAIKLVYDDGSRSEESFTTNDGVTATLEPEILDENGLFLSGGRVKREVTVSYQGFTTKYEVTVAALGVDTTDAILVFYLGEKLDMSGLHVIHYEYDAGNKRQHSYELGAGAYTPFIIDPENAETNVQSTEYTFTKTGTYRVKIVQSDDVIYSIEVKDLSEATYKGITVDEGSASLSFTQNGVFSAEGIIVTATYEGQKNETETRQFTFPVAAQTEEHPDGYTVQAPDLTELGSKQVVVTYKDKTAEYTVRVVGERKLTDIELIEPTNKDFYMGDKFNTEGLVVTAKYDNNDNEPIHNYTVKLKGEGVDVDWTADSEFTFAKEGEYTVEITFEGHTKSYTITVHFVGVKIVVNKTFHVGDTLTKSDFTVTYYPKDGEPSVQNNIVMRVGQAGGIDPMETYKFEEAREYVVYLLVYVPGAALDTSFTINVLPAEPVEESISVTPNEKKYAVGETFKAEDFTVTYTSSTGETSTLSLGDDGYTVHLGAKDGALVNEEYSFDEATELTLVFVYNDLEFSVTVTVTEKVEVREVKITKLEFYADLYAHLEMSQDDFAVVKDAARMTTNGVQTVFENNKGFLVDGTRLNVMVDAANKDVYEFVWYNADEQVIARGTYTKESGGDVDEKAYELAKVEIKELDGSIWYVLSGTFSGYADSELTELLNTIHFDFQYNSAVVLGINDDYSRADTIADLTRKVTCSNGNWELRFDIHNVETYAYHAHWDGIQAIDPSAPNNDFKVSTEIAADGVETRYDGRIYTLINKNGQSGVLNYWGCVGLRITDIFTPSTAEDVGSYKKLECDVGTSLWNDGGANYRGESEAVADASKNQWSYWYVAEDGWGECGEKLASANLTTDGSHIIVEYSGGSVNFSVQVFYEHAGLLTHGKEYVLRFKLIASANCTVNSSNGGDAFNVPQNSDGYVVTFHFTYDSAKSMFCLQLPGCKLTGQESMKFEIFDVEWYDVDPDEEVPGIISGFSDAGLETNDEGTVAYYTVTLESSGIGADAKDDFTLFDGDVTFDCAKAEVVEGGLKLYFDVTARELGKTWFFPHLKYKGAPWNGSDGNINVADFDEKKITVGFKEYRTHCNATETYGMPVLDVVISPNAYTVDWNGIKLAAEDGRAILTIKGTIIEGAPEFAIEADLQKHGDGYDSTAKMGSATYEGRNWTLKIDITDVAVYDDDIYIVHIYIDSITVDVDFGGGSAEGFTPGDAFTEAEKTFQLGTAENLFNDGRTFLTVSIKTAEGGGGEQVKEVVLELTQKALGLVSDGGYTPNNKDHTVGDFTFTTHQAMAENSTNIQMQKGNNNAFIENKTAFPGRIKSIEIVFTSSQTSGTISLDLGATTDYGTTESLTMSKNGTQTFTADEGTNFRFFKLYDPSAVCKITSITITYLVSTVVCSHSSLTKTDGTPAGCETPGTEDYWTCDKCHRMFNTGENPTDDNEIFAPVKIEALGHSYTEWEDDGDGATHTGTCDKCQQQVKERHDKLGEGGKCSKCSGELTVEAEAEKLYTFSSTSKTGSNSGYAGNCDVEVDGVTWNVEGNSTMNPWRFGGKSLTGVDRKLTGKTAIKGTVSKIVIAFGDCTATVNSITLNVYTSDPTAAGASATYTRTVTHTANGSVTVEAGGEEWKDCYFQLVFNVTLGSKNQYVTVEMMEFWGYPDSAAAAASTSLVSATPDLFFEDKH